MNAGRVTVIAVVITVAGTAVAFGPLVPALSLASDPGPVINNEGSLTVTSVTFPSTATMEPASYGAANHYISVPPVAMTFGALRGTPTLIYSLSLETGFKQSTTHFMNPSYGPRYEAEMGTATIDLPEDPPESYAGEFSLAMRNESGKHVLAQRNVTVQVSV